MSTRKRSTKQSSIDPVPQDTAEDGHYCVYWPRTRRQVAIKPLAKRPATLQGKTIGLLWDYVFRGDEVFAILEKELKARYPGLRFVNWREFGNTHGSDEHQVVKALPTRMKELKVDAVISGMGC